MSDDKFEQAISELQSQIDTYETTIVRKEKGVSPLVIMAIVIPFLVFFMLYLLSPRCVMSEVNGQQTRDGKKVFLWTLGVTLLSWGGLYLYANVTKVV